MVQIPVIEAIPPNCANGLFVGVEIVQLLF